MAARLLFIVLLALLDAIKAGEPQGKGSPYCAKEFQDWCSSSSTCGPDSFCGGYCASCDGWGCTPCGDCLGKCVTGSVNVNGHVYPPCASFDGKDLSTCPSKFPLELVMAIGIPAGVVLLIVVVAIGGCMCKKSRVAQPNVQMYAPNMATPGEHLLGAGERVDINMYAAGGTAPLPPVAHQMVVPTAQATMPVAIGTVEGTPAGETQATVVFTVRKPEPAARVGATLVEELGEFRRPCYFLPTAGCWLLFIPPTHPVRSCLLALILPCASANGHVKRVYVGSLVPGGLAEASGLTVGSTVRFINGTKVTRTEQAVALLQAANEIIEFTVAADGRGGPATASRASV